MMTWSSLSYLLGSVLLLLAFLAAVVFVDPAAYYGSEDLDFCGLTGVFFTLEMLPLVFILFSNDAKVGRLPLRIEWVVVTAPENLAVNRNLPPRMRGSAFNTENAKSPEHDVSHPQENAQGAAWIKNASLYCI